MTTASKKLEIDQSDIKPAFGLLIEDLNTNVFELKAKIDTFNNASKSIFNSTVNLSQALYDNDAFKGDGCTTQEDIFINFKNYSLGDFKVVVPEYKDFIEDKEDTWKWDEFPEVQSVSSFAETVYRLYNPEEVLKPGKEVNLIKDSNDQVQGIIVEEKDIVSVAVEDTNVAVAVEDTDVIVAVGNTDVTVTREDTDVAVALEDTEVTLAAENTDVAVTGEDTDVAVAVEDKEVTLAAENTDVTVVGEDIDVVAVEDTDVVTVEDIDVETVENIDVVAVEDTDVAAVENTDAVVI